MSFQLLLELPSDIIEQDVIPLLSPEDIISLKKTCISLHNLVQSSSFVWQQLFKKTFGTDPTPYALSRSPDFYRLRSRGKLYAWGAIADGRLGVVASEVRPVENLNRTAFKTGICRPTKVPEVEDVLAGVNAAGFSLQILTSGGRIWSTSKLRRRINQREQGTSGMRAEPSSVLFPMPRGPQYLGPEHRRNSRQSSAFSQLQPTFRDSLDRQSEQELRKERELQAQYKLAEDQKVSNRFFHQALPADVKFVNISSGRKHFIGTDNKGRLWIWDGQEHGIQLKFLDSSDKVELLKKGKMLLKAVAGWSWNLAYIYNYGLVYWHDSTVDEINSSAIAEAILIPGTGDTHGDNKIVDFIAGEDFAIYITNEGAVYRNDLIGDESIELTMFKDYLVEHSNAVKPKFTRLSGSFKSFAVFSNDGLVLLGHSKKPEPTIVDELQYQDCISIAVGDYHFLALLKDGTLLSWGLESACCGCLGLGKTEEIIQSGAGLREGQSLRVSKPTKIPIEGRVVAISAAGWHSCAIIIE